MESLKGKYPIKFYVYLVLSTLSIMGISFMGLASEVSVLKIILGVGAPALFFAFCIDSAPKVKSMRIEPDSIYLNAIRWHGFRHEEMIFKRSDIKEIRLGGNGYTIEVDTGFGEVKFDARYLTKDGETSHYLNPNSVLSLMKSGG